MANAREDRRAAKLKTEYDLALARFNQASAYKDADFERYMQAKESLNVASEAYSKHLMTLGL